MKKTYLEIMTATAAQGYNGKILAVDESIAAQAIAGNEGDENEIEMHLKAIAGSTAGNEFNDSSNEFSPVNLTLGAASALKEETSGIFKNWAPVKLLPYGVREVTFTLPYAVIANLKDGQFVNKTKLTDLDIKDVDAEEAKLRPILTAESAGKVVDALANPTTKMAPLAVGAKMNLIKIDGNKDLTGASLGHNDILLPNGVVETILVEMTDGTKTETLNLKTSTMYTLQNKFYGNKQGDTSAETLNGEYKFVVSKNTKVIVDATSLTTGSGKASELLGAAIATGKVVITGTLNAKVNLKSGDFESKDGSCVAEYKVINGDKSDITAADSIKDIEFKIVGFTISGGLSNTNGRFAGNFTINEGEDFSYDTKPSTPITTEVPTESKDVAKDEQAFTMVKRQSFAVKERMEADFVVKLAEYFEHLVLCEEALLPVAVINSMNFRTTTVTGSHTRTTVQFQNTTDAKANIKTGIENKIEGMVKELVRKSGTKTTMRAYGVSSYKAIVLCNEEENLDESFRMSDGTVVEISKSTRVGINDIWISIELNGGPVEEGIKVLGFANTLSNANVVRKKVHAKGDAQTNFITVTPSFDTMFKMNILGKLTLV